MRSYCKRIWQPFKFEAHYIILLYFCKKSCWISGDFFCKETKYQSDQQTLDGTLQENC